MMPLSHAVQFYNDDVFLIDAVAAFISWSAVGRDVFRLPEWR